MVLYEHTVNLFEDVYVYTTKRMNSECQCPKVFISKRLSLKPPISPLHSSMHWEWLVHELVYCNMTTSIFQEDGFVVVGYAKRHCTENGTWFIPPGRNVSWTDFGDCIKNNKHLSSPDLQVSTALYPIYNPPSEPPPPPVIYYNQTESGNYWVFVWCLVPYFDVK